MTNPATSRGPQSPGHAIGDPRRRRFIEVMSGRASGPGPAIARSAASLAAALYGRAIAWRNAAYEAGWLRVRQLDRPVVSVGNLSVGGTGKTVLVAELARWLLDVGVKPAVLTRGYRGERSPVGSDEAALLRLQLPGVRVEADPDRFAAGSRLLAGDDPPQLFLLDDGFQHRRLGRDLDVVAVDATMDPFGPLGRLLPRGLFREPVASLARADFVVLTRADQASPLDLERLTRRLAAITPDLPILRCRHAPVGLLAPTGLADRRGPAPRRPLAELDGTGYLAFCGIGNPEAFRATVETLPGRCLDFVAFDDHHVYGEAELAGLADRARAAGAELMLTTGKDCVKLAGTAVRPPILAVDVAVEWLDGPTAADPLRLKVLELARAGRPV